jgi:putative peptidoglycan lipid II flippase
VVLLPDLSRKIRANDTDGGHYAFNRATEFALALTIPAAVALFIAATPLISVLFQRGAYTSADAQATATALMIYSLGLPAFVFQKVLQPLYFAREDTKTPFYYALVAMVVNLVVAIGLSYQFGYLSAAIAVTVSAWGMTLMLWLGSRTMGKAAQFDARFYKTIPKIIIASLIMGIVVYVLQIFLHDALNTRGVRYMALLALVTSGILAYMLALMGLRAYSVPEIKRMIKRG